MTNAVPEKRRWQTRVIRVHQRLCMELIMRTNGRTNYSESRAPYAMHGMNEDVSIDKAANRTSNSDHTSHEQTHPEPGIVPKADDVSDILGSLGRECQ